MSSLLSPQGTGRVLATKSHRTFTSAAPHSYARLRSADSAAFDALQKLFPQGNGSDSTPHPTASLSSSKSPRPRSSPSSSSADALLDASHPFHFALDPFEGLAADEGGQADEEGDNVEAEAASDDDDDDSSFTRSPFLAPTPSRLSTASSSSSVSARSRRESDGRPSVSPLKGRSSVSKKLELEDEETPKEATPQSASTRRNSRRSGRHSTVSFADEDEELPSAPSSRRRSGAGRAEEDEAGEERKEGKEEETKEAPQVEEEAVADVDLDVKYDGDGDDEADAGDAAMGFNDAADDDQGANGDPHDEDEKTVASPPPPRPPRRPRVAGKSRRETTRLVDEAKRVGMLEEEEAEAFGGRRRPKRHRIEPLRYWENEHITYERTQGGVGNVMPVPKDVVRSNYTSPVSGAGRRTQRR